MDYLKQKLYLIQFRVGHGAKYFHFLRYNTSIGSAFEPKAREAIEMDIESLVAILSAFDVHYSDAYNGESEMSIAVVPTFEPLPRDTTHPEIVPIVSVTPSFEMLDRLIAYVVIEPVVAVVPIFMPMADEAFNVIVNNSVSITPKMSGEVCLAFDGGRLNWKVNVANAKNNAQIAEAVEGEGEGTNAVKYNFDVGHSEADVYAEYNGTISLGYSAEAEAWETETTPIEGEGAIKATSQFEISASSEAYSVAFEKPFEVGHSCSLEVALLQYSLASEKEISLSSLCEAVLSVYAYAEASHSIENGYDVTANVATLSEYLEFSNKVLLGSSADAELYLSNSVFADIDQEIDTGGTLTATTSIGTNAEAKKPFEVGHQVTLGLSTPTSASISQPVTMASECEATLSTYAYASINQPVKTAYECEMVLAYGMYFIEPSKCEISLGSNFEADIILGGGVYAEAKNGISLGVEATPYINALTEHIYLNAGTELTIAEATAVIKIPVDTNANESIEMGMDITTTLYGSRLLKTYSDKTLKDISSSTLAGLTYGAVPLRNHTNTLSDMASQSMFTLQYTPLA